MPRIVVLALAVSQHYAFEHVNTARTDERTNERTDV